MPKIKYFKGLNNVGDPLRMGLGWLAQADNVNVTDTGALVKRDGYSQLQTGSFTGAYTTQDFQRMYLVDNGVLRTFEGAVLRAGLSRTLMYWAEINDHVYFNNGVDRGVILPDNTVLDWAWEMPAAPEVAPTTGSLPAGMYQIRCSFILADGRETGTGDVAEITVTGAQGISITDIPHTPGALTRVYIAPANSDVYQVAATTAASALVWNFSNDALGADLRTPFVDPIPQGADVIQFFKGRAYAAQYSPEHDQTVVWFSESLAYHLFNLNTDFFIVPGQVVMLAPTDDVLVVGTTTRVLAYTDNKLEWLAPYGVIPGQHWARDDGRILFWTARGVCSAMPFTNLTEKYVSVAPGVRAGGCLVRSGGQKRYLSVIQQGGSAFNAL